jgi:3-methylcrotonyl-CoA carboxylase beta subunit
MSIIKTRIDTQSDIYKENYAANHALVEELKNEMDRAANERSEKAKNRLKETGKLPVQKKFELLLDRNTPFLEIAPLAAKDQYDKKVHKAGAVAGIGVIKGREVFVSANDATIKGGGQVIRFQSRKCCVVKPLPWKIDFP